MFQLELTKIHLRLTRGLAAKTNWFNINDGRKSGVVIGLSIQEDNAEILGQQPNGRMDKQRLNSIFDGIVSCLNDIGYSDIISNPKNGTVNIPGATSGDKIRIRMKLLEYERQLGNGAFGTFFDISPFCSRTHWR